MSTRYVVPLLVVFLAAACTEPAPESPATTEAGADIASILTDSARLAVDGGEIWYRVTGSGSGTPVVLLHGGPGFTSHYLKPMEALGNDRPVIRFDQLGSGKSDVTSDTTLFTVESFMGQLEALRAHLGLDRWHVYGHSWGTMLGAEYWRTHPDAVESLVLASAALDAREWERHARELLQNLPDSMIEAVETREAEGNYDAPDYQAALNEFYARYVWLRPVPADLDSIFATYNPDIYGYMWGPSEFTVTGTLGDFDATPYLREIDVPVLYTVGEVDEANPETIARFGEMTPGSEVVVIPDAAHITAWDNPEADVAAVREFLRAVDGGDATVVEARSLLGEPLPRPVFTGETLATYQANLEAALADREENPDEADALIWVGRRLAYLGRYGEAIDVYTEGHERWPDDPRFLRHRGHRHLTIRELQAAERDFEAAWSLIEAAGTPDQVEPDGLPNALGIPVSTLHSNIRYHLALSRYLQGDFEGAAEAWRADVEAAVNPDMVVASSYWLWLTLSRLGRDAEASEVLVPIDADMEIIENTAYHDLLLLFKDELEPSDLLGSGEDALQNTTTAYGVAAWHLVNGREARANQMFERIVSGDGPWAAFGYLAAEAELAR